MKEQILIALAIFVGAMGLITFILYGVDKAKAKSGAYRISEKVLLTFSFFGGAIGGIFAMTLFRHKTKHWYFTAINVLGLLAIVASAICIMIFI